MNISCKSFPNYCELIIYSKNVTIQEDITDLDGIIDQDFINKMQNVVEDMIYHNEYIKEKQKNNVSRSFRCQRDIEGESQCVDQCEHCKKYYAPLG